MAKRGDKTVDLERENAELRRQLDESLAQQTATAEVLGVINASPGDLAPVFDAMLDKAIRLCDAVEGVLWTIDGERGRVAAARGLPADFVASLSERGQSGTNLLLERVMRGEHLIHVPDTMQSELYGLDPIGKAAVEAGVRTLIWVALVKNDAAVGAFAIGRREVRPFTDKQIALLQNFATQAVIAMENARLLGETREALDQQTATAEVLQVINASPGDLAPVFDAMLEKAMRLCDAAFGTLSTFDGNSLRTAATRGVPADYAKFRMDNPPVYGPGTGPARLLAGELIIHNVDLSDEEAYRNGEPNRRALVDMGGARTALQVALRKDDVLLGGITIYRKEVRPFSEKEIALLQNFAAQAVIAMENARLITETKEALEQQQAIAEVLQVINSSPGDLAPVFDAMLERARGLCGAAFGTFMVRDGDRFSAAAVHGAVPPPFAAIVRDGFVPGPSSPIGRLRKGEPFVHIPDLAAVASLVTDDPVPRQAVELGGIRTLLMVPLVKDGQLLGAFTNFRQEVRPFSDKQIALLQNFAAQAVIAMENARLITETREALDQQTATAEVLQVINSSPGDLTPVFDAMLEKAMHLCGAAFGELYSYDGERYQTVALLGVPPAYADYRARFGRTTNPGTASGRILAGERVVHIADLTDDEVYRSGSPGRRAMIELGGARAQLAVPLRKDNALLGMFVIYRQEVGPFTDKQIALLQNFADQAVIAIENARLLGELRERTDDLTESLEYQTATSDVLKVMSGSAFELQPVLETVVATAVRLCRADQATIYRVHDGEYRGAATSGQEVPEYERLERAVRIRPGTGTLIGRVALSRGTVHILDCWTDPLYEVKEDARMGGIHTLLGVPLLREGVPIGAIGLGRRRIEAYTEKEIELVSTFADQAVIAIENARLLGELRERTDDLTESLEYQTATSDVLKVISRSTFDLQPVLDTLVETAARLCRADLGVISGREDSGLRVAATYSTTPEYEAFIRGNVLPLDRGSLLGRAAIERKVVQIPDLMVDPEFTLTELITLARARTALGVPLMREDEVIGGMMLARQRVEPFTERQIELVRTFADQAVIAIENTRLITETSEARDAAEGSLRELKLAQANLIQAEKMASLGQLTAGIAHEIKNPLNFVNNFATLSNELLTELKDIAAPAIESLDDDKRAELDETMAMLSGNLDKIAEHGRRADGIVKSMLAHSRGGSGDRQAVDLNALLDESLNLAYHGARAQDQAFNIMLERDFDNAIKPIEVVPQDITRVFLNLFGNGFYAANKRAHAANGNNGGDAAFRPVLHVATHDLGDAVEIKVRDNGTGIPPAIRDKLFQPFFTTKPTGEGTGLGLSISYDIVTQQHGGTIAVASEEGEFTEFTIRLPRGGQASSARASA
jgi:GAF domain-containing protein